MRVVELVLGGTVVATRQTLLSTITTPASTSDISAPVKATVTVTAPASGAMPASPPVALADVVITQYDVRLDIFTTTTNSPAGITGAPATGAVGTSPSCSRSRPVPWRLRTPWAAPVEDIEVQLPAGTPGQRQWLRLKELTYHWSAASGSILGTTDCRLVGPIVAASGTVETPLYGFFSSLSSTWPESATNFSAGSPGTFGSFGARVTVTDVNGAGSGTPSSSCTVTDPSGCTTGQQVTATVTAGSLTQEAAKAGSNPSSTAIVLTKDDGNSGTYSGASAVTVSTTSQLMEGALNPVTVTDVRGGTAGWSLTAALSGPFTEVGSGQIAESAAKLVQVGCSPLAGSATRNPGSGGTLSSAVTLCGVDPGVDDSDGQSGGGQYTVTGTVELTVPAFQKAGEYASTLVITLT